MEQPAKQQLTPLEREMRSAIPTIEAARHLSRQPQTLRAWASRETGPLRPIRVNGRLAWPVAEIRRLLAKGVAGRHELDMQDPRQQHIAHLIERGLLSEQEAVRLAHEICHGGADAEVLQRFVDDVCATDNPDHARSACRILQRAIAGGAHA